MDEEDSQTTEERASQLCHEDWLDSFWIRALGITPSSCSFVTAHLALNFLAKLAGFLGEYRNNSHFALGGRKHEISLWDSVF